MSEPSEAGAALTALVRAAKLPEPAERKRIRREAGLSLRRLGEALGVTEGAMWRWENGTPGQGPSLENAIRYRELLEELQKAVA